jgi:hypothetical protein
MKDKKGEKLLEATVGHAVVVMTDVGTHDAREYSPKQVGCWRSVAHELQCQYSAGWTERASLIRRNKESLERRFSKNNLKVFLLGNARCEPPHTLLELIGSH